MVRALASHQCGPGSILGLDALCSPDSIPGLGALYYEEIPDVFHLPKDSGKFRKFRWEMFIGEERVPFDTRSIHSQAPFSARCIPHQK